MVRRFRQHGCRRFWAVAFRRQETHRQRKCVPLTVRAVLKGAGTGPAWHAAKILECGTASTVIRKRPDSIMA
jgi:hypothetical protein